MCRDSKLVGALCNGKVEINVRIIAKKENYSMSFVW